MKPNELRIGNYISDIHSESGMWKIVSLGERIVKYGNYKPNIYTSGYENLRPILLTTEILEKCGFEKEYQSEWTIKYSLIKDGRFGFDWNKSFDWRSRFYAEHFNHIKHLHQLQNLYYALTGEELNYQP
jgi:hypothetical protein